MRDQLLVITTALLLLSPLQAEPTRVLNQSRPGEHFDVGYYLKKGKMNVVVFYSEYSPASLAFLKRLETLASADSQLEVSLLNIDRKNATSIDWRSPLAQDLNLKSLPFVVLYDGKVPLKQGYEARRLLLNRADLLAR